MEMETAVHLKKETICSYPRANITSMLIQEMNRFGCCGAIARKEACQKIKEAIFCRKTKTIIFKKMD